MRGQQLCFEVAAAAVPEVEALLELAGALAIALSDAADDPVLEPEPNTAPLWPHVVVRALFPAGAALAGLQDLLRGTHGATRSTISALTEAHWHDAGLRQVFTARAFGSRLWLAPADDEQVPVGRRGVRLHMGFAFGTGEHPTTSLCLDWLDAHVQDGTTILDYGCGSGVLAIAALVLGASSAAAIDIDPQALTATRANATLNGVAERVFAGAPDELPPTAVDIVAANILATPLIKHAGLFAATVRPGGALVLSGILERQVPLVLAAYERAFSGFEETVRDGWACLAATRNAG